LDYQLFGTSIASSHSTADTFIAIKKNEQLSIRPVNQRRGVIKYAVDQYINPNSIIICPGGVYNNQSIIMGMIGSTSVNSESKTIENQYKREIKKYFSNVRGMWVGEEAFTMLQNGARLTSSVRSPKECDLQLDE